MNIRKSSNNTAPLSILDFNAVPDGRTDCSKAFQKALDTLAENGGGRLNVPAGSYLTGPLELKTNTHLHLETDAIIQFISDPSLYPPVRTRWEGIVCYAMHPLIFAHDASNISLTGEGTIDGGGSWWWKTYREKRARGQSFPELPIEQELAKLNGNIEHQPSGGGGREIQFLRPPLIQFFRCSHIVIEGLTVRNSPFWTIHPVFSQYIEINNVTIINPPDAPNTDGIDIDSCSDIAISHSLIDVGDDCLVLKAGSGPQGLAENVPTRNVVVQGCTFLSGHGGVVIGRETAGGIENIEVFNCRCIGTDRGIRIKSRRGRGGTVQNLDFRNLLMDKVLVPLTINLYYHCGAPRGDRAQLFSLEIAPMSPLTPRLRNIKISNIVADRCRASTGFIAGLPESKIENLVIENYIASLSNDDLAEISTSEMYEGLPEIQARGIRIRNAKCVLSGVHIGGVKDQEAIIKESGSTVIDLDKKEQS